MMTRLYRQQLIGIFVALLLLAVVISACSSEQLPISGGTGASESEAITGEAGVVRYMVAAGSPFSVAVLERIPEFEAATGIDVEVIELPYEQTLPKGIIEARNKSGAYDVIQINRPNLAALSEPGLLLPLEEYLSQELIDDLYPVHREYATFDDQLYAVPHSNDIRAFYYRTDLFEEAGITKVPENWDEMLAAAQALNAPDQGLYGIILAGSPKGPGIWVLSDFIHQAGGTILDEEGNVAFDGPEGVRALQFMTDLVGEYKVAPPSTADNMWGETRNLFAQGRGAMVIEFNDIIPLLEGPDSAVAGKYDLALLPGDVRGGTNNAGWLLGLPQGAQNPENAGKLIEWIMSPEIQMHMSRESGTLSGRQSVIDQLIATGEEGLPTGDVDGKARWAFYQQVIDTTYELPRTSKEPEIEEALGEALTAALSGAQTPEAALTEAGTKVRSLLQKPEVKTGEAGVVRYMVAAGSPFSVAVLERIPEFEAATGIDVEVIELPYEQTLPKGIIEARNKSGAYDVIQINRPNLAALSEPGLLLPLEEYLSQELIDDLYPVHREYATFDDQLYAVPHSNDIRAFYYRTDLFEEAGITKVPENWDEMLAAAQALNAPDQGLYGIILAGSPKGPGIWVLSDFIHQAGGTILDEEGNVAFDGPEGVRALQFMTDLVGEYKVAPPSTADNMWGETRNLFAQGRGAMVIEFNDIIPLLEGPDSAVAGKYDLALLPGDVRGGTNNAGWLLGLPQGAQNPENAGKLIEWIMSPEIQMHMSRESGTLSGRQSVIDQLIATGEEGLPTGDVDGKARWAFYQQVIDTTYELPRTSKEPEIEEALGEALTAALSGAQTPEAALTEAGTKVRSLLQE